MALSKCWRKMLVAVAKAPKVYATKSGAASEANAKF
jgi:hypothetical protein